MTDLQAFLLDAGMLAALYLGFGAALFSRYRLAEFAEIDRSYIRRHGRLAPAWYWLVAVVFTVLSWPKMFWGR